MPHADMMPFDSASGNHSPADLALLEAVAVRDAVFALGDDDLVLLADALLYGIAQTTRRSPASPSETPLAVA